MSTLSLPKLVGPDLTAEARLGDATTVQLALCGTADGDVRVLLEAFIKQLHAEVVRIGIKRVDLDLRELEFMNSSCLKILVSWLAVLRDLAPGEQYKLRIRSNPNLLWQRRSLTALQCFAVELVSIET